jgi:ferredoxin--NADP+ reductase
MISQGILMFEIVGKRELAPNIKWIKVKAPLVARNAKPGQFVVIRSHERGERVPLTLFKWDKEEGTIEVVFQEVGKTTYELGTYGIGDKIADVVGPLGKPAHIENFGTSVIVSEGVGAPVGYSITKALKEAGNYVISILGFRNKQSVILEDEFREVSDELLITTDDGSYVRKGFTTDVLSELLESGRRVDYVFTAGPVIMMKRVADITKKYGIKTHASLNPIMVDGTGMCGACRVTVGGRIVFACVDGPNFDANQVDFDELMKRLAHYREEEKLALERFLQMGVVRR